MSSMEYGKSLDELMDELSGPKLEQAPPSTVLEPEETPPITDEVTDIDDEEEEEEEENIITDLSSLPELIVDVINVFASTVAAAYSGTANKDKYRLEEEEKKSLEKAWKIYLKNTPDFKMKPSTMLVVTTAIIYLPKAIMAFQERKELKAMQNNDGQNS